MQSPFSELYWTPTISSLNSSPLTRFLQYVNRVHSTHLPLHDYAALHTWSTAHPTAFWSSLATFLNFLPSPYPVLTTHPDQTLPHLLRYQWFPTARLNYAAIVLRYAKTQPNRICLVYRPEDAADDVGYRRRLTFAQLETKVLRIAAALREIGVRRGDSVAGVLANTPDAVIALLATAAVGAMWSCCAPDFGHVAVASRLAQTAPKVLFYSPVYMHKGRVHGVVDNIRKVVPALSQLKLVVCVPAGCRMGDVCIGELRRQGVGVPHVFMREFELTTCGSYDDVSMDDAVFCMFSSGTTGRPKCIVQGCGVLLNQMKEHVLHHSLGEDSVMLYATSTGWMLFNWIVAALAVGCRVVLYDGAPLPGGDEFRMVTVAEEEGVTHFGSGAKYYQALSYHCAIRPPLKRGLPINSLKMIMATGSPSTKEHFDFASSFFGSHVQYVSMSGGTEINGCFALGCPWKPVVSPELQCAGLGMDVCVFDQGGRPVVGQSGELVCRNFCPCMPLYFAHDTNHTMYRKAYFETFGEHVWSHGDFAIHTENGGFVISGRSDSTLNPGGVRIGTADLYDVVESLDYIEGALVVESSQTPGGSVVMFVVMRGKDSLDHAKKQEIRHELRKNLSPRHVPRTIIQVTEIPYTFSGKKCEIPVKKMLQGEEPNNKEAVKNPTAFDAIRAALERNSLLPRNSYAACPKSKM